MAKEFSADNARITFLGREVAASNISYTASQEKNPYYRIGQNKPYTYAKSRKTFEGTMTIYQSEYDALRSSLPAGRDVMDIEAFDIVIVYADASGRVATRRLKNAEITGFGEEIDSGNDIIMVELPYVFEEAL